MRAIELHGPHDARLVEVKEPEIRAGGVKIRVGLAGICGSDLGLYEQPLFDGDYVHPILGTHAPFTLGHEIAGTVEEVSDEVEGICVGDLVAVRPNVWDGSCPACLRGSPNLCENWGFLGVQGGGGGFSDLLVVAAEQVHVLPPGMTLEDGVLIEPMSVAWHAVKRAGVSGGQTVFIAGAGPIGLAVLLASQAMGASRIIVSEVSEGRRALAEKFGAIAVDPRSIDVVEHVRGMSNGGADASFDAAAAGAASFLPTIDVLRTGGNAVVVGVFHESLSIDPSLFMFTEKNVTGSFAYTDEDFTEVLQHIASGRLKPQPFITSTIDLTEAVEAGLDHLVGEGRSTEIKILVRP